MNSTFPAHPEAIAEPLAAISAAHDHHTAMQQRFGWQVPERLNMAQWCCGRWAAQPDAKEKIAVIADAASGEATFHSYFELHEQASRLASVLAGAGGLGVQRGDRVAIVLPQRFETAVAYMGVMQAGAVGMPLSMLFGPEALEYRLQDSAAVVAICDAAGWEHLNAVRERCPALRAVLRVDGGQPEGGAVLEWAHALAAASPVFPMADTLADEPAVLIYTSGTTGNPKGGLIPHRALVGNLSGFVCSQNLFGFLPGPAGELPFPSAQPGSAPPLSAQSASAQPACLEPTSEPPVAEAEAPVPFHLAGLAALDALDALVAEQDGGADADARAYGNPSAEELALPLGSEAVFWSPADWAWTGGLMDALLPTLAFGRPIVAYNGRFSPEVAFTLLQRHRVTHSFLFPTALKAMMKAYPQPREQFQFQLQGLMSAGEAVGDAVFAYCREQLGVVVNEMFGQTEVNYIVGNFSLNRVWGDAAPATSGHTADSLALGWPAKPGSMGKGYPGHRVTTIDDAGNECPVGEPGEVAVHRRSQYPAPAGQRNPIFMLGYWGKPEATLAKFTGGPDDSWFRTGDMAVRDADGYLWYHGRADDVFKVAGYRIGPSEIENCLVKHPAVLNAAVVPKPDAQRGALVKAYVVLSNEYIADHALLASVDGVFDDEKLQPLVAELQAHVKERLAPYEYPKDIEFVTTLPMTTTGKVQRRILRLQEEERARLAAHVTD